MSMLPAIRSNFVLALAVVTFGVPGAGRGGVALTAQASPPCTLVTTDDIQPLAPGVAIPDGVSAAVDGSGFSSCRYTWGTGTRRVNLGVLVNDAARLFAGAAPDAIRQALQSSVRVESDDAVITDVGDGAVFKADSPYSVHATAYLKGRLLQLHLDGVDAREQKDRVIELLKAAASRL